MNECALGHAIDPQVSSLTANGKAPAAAPEPEPQEEPQPWPFMNGDRQTPQPGRGNASTDTQNGKLRAGGRAVDESDVPWTGPFANAPSAVLAIGIAPWSMSCATTVDLTVCTLL